MDFYGVGVKFGGVDDMLPVFLETNCWFMGYYEDEKPRLDKQISLVKEGDILFVKSYGTTAQSSYYIRAIGIVSSLKKPDGIPMKYADRPGFSVIWIKYYENPIQLSASEYGRGGVHTYTIHQEKNEHLIDKIKDIMRYDYREE